MYNWNALACQRDVVFVGDVSIFLNASHIFQEVHINTIKNWAVAGGVPRALGSFLLHLARLIFPYRDSGHGEFLSSIYPLQYQSQKKGEMHLSLPSYLVNIVKKEYNEILFQAFISPGAIICP